jgi:hypothetical protein
VIGRGSFDRKDLIDGRMSEPGKVLVRQNEFVVADEDPDTVRGNVRDLNGQSVGAKHL